MTVTLLAAATDTALGTKDQALNISSIAAPVVGLGAAVAGYFAARRSSTASLAAAQATAQASLMAAQETARAAKETAVADRDLERERIDVQRNEKQEAWLWEQKREVFVALFTAVDEWLLGIAYVDDERAVQGYVRLVNLGPQQALYGSQATQDAGEALISFWHQVMQEAHDTGVEPDHHTVVMSALGHTRVLRNAVRAELGLKPLAFTEIPPPPVATAEPQEPSGADSQTPE